MDDIDRNIVNLLWQEGRLSQEGWRAPSICRAPRCMIGCAGWKPMESLRVMEHG
jgi:hypothetical protein